MRREFGNGWKELKTMLIFGRFLGMFVEAGLIWCSVRDGHPERIETNWIGAVAIGMIPAVFVGITAVFSIRVENGWIESVLFRRWVLKRGRAAELTRMEIGASNPATFHFADGMAIRVIAASPKILGEMRQYIQGLQPRVKNGTANTPMSQAFTKPVLGSGWRM